VPNKFLQLASKRLEIRKRLDHFDYLNAYLQR
jgi:hypothetical protein